MARVLVDAIDAFKSGGLGIEHNANIKLLGMP